MKVLFARLCMCAPVKTLSAGHRMHAILSSVDDRDTARAESVPLVVKLFIHRLPMGGYATSQALSDATGGDVMCADC